jgi:uncharacterized membrane protein HdeD (DUF308 family)
MTKHATLDVERCRMATANPARGFESPLRRAKKITGWYIVEALLFIALGIFAIVEPAVAGLGVTLFVGWLLIFGGVLHLIGAFKGGGLRHISFQLLIGLLYLLGGFYALTHPLLAMGTLTLVLAVVILVGGIIEIALYFELRGVEGAGWMLVNAIVTLFLGGLIWFHWPSSSIWAIGILVGVQLLVTGWTRLMLGLGARRLIRHTAG